MSSLKPIRVKYWTNYTRKHPGFTGGLIDRNNAKSWWLNGKLHREDGPSVEFANGDKGWYKNGEIHREDGPAVEYLNGTKYWYLNGTLLTEQEHRIAVRQIKLKLLDIDQHSL
jgi:hypothetical protein